MLRLDFYSAEDLVQIVERSAKIFGLNIDKAGAKELGRRSRGTPRIANRLLRRVRDFAQVGGHEVITAEVADQALEMLAVDKKGLDEMDRRILLSIIDKFDGGPIGIETLATAVSEEKSTLEDVYEPFLIQSGFLIRTPRGRMATGLTYEHFGRPFHKKEEPPGLF
jgi:Holliday junction DNA helicase RuvB